jgi:hypothetical protein
MRVKLCAWCPYSPRDLAPHYDPEATLYACAKCDSEQLLRKTHWRGKCSTTISTPTPNVAQQSAAPFAIESSASSVIIAREPPSVQRSALITSRLARNATADGCGKFALPDDGRSENDAKISWRSTAPDKEPAH